VCSALLIFYNLSTIVWDLTQGSDLHRTNQHVVGLALSALSNICTAVMARELSAEVERLLLHRIAYIRKKVLFDRATSFLFLGIYYVPALFLFSLCASNFVRFRGRYWFSLVFSIYDTVAMQALAHSCIGEVNVSLG